MPMNTKFTVQFEQRYFREIAKQSVPFNSYLEGSYSLFLSGADFQPIFLVSPLRLALETILISCCRSILMNEP
jgi:hypothetical protein